MRRKYQHVEPECPQRVAIKVLICPSCNSIMDMVDARVEAEETSDILYQCCNCTNYLYPPKGDRWGKWIAKRKWYNPYTWLYLDTDHFFITGKFTHVNEETEKILNEIKLPSDIIYHNFIYIDKLKQYITGDRAKIAERGKPIYKREDIIAIMKQKIREIKINDLFIE